MNSNHQNRNGQGYGLPRTVSEPKLEVLPQEIVQLVLSPIKTCKRRLKEWKDAKHEMPVKNYTKQ